MKEQAESRKALRLLCVCTLEGYICPPMDTGHGKGRCYGGKMPALRGKTVNFAGISDSFS